MAKSPSFRLGDLGRVDVGAALDLLDVDFPRPSSRYDGESAAAFLDRLRFPDAARHLALEVFARSFFADPRSSPPASWWRCSTPTSSARPRACCSTSPTTTTTQALGAARRYLTGLGVRSGPGSPVERARAVRRQPARRDSRRRADPGVGDGAGGRPGHHPPAAAGAAGHDAWRARVARPAYGAAVRRLAALARPAAAADRPAFLGTSGFGPLDNVCMLDRFEEGARPGRTSTRGSVVELHAYALPGEIDEAALKARLRAELDRIYPELAGAGVTAEEWLVREDCPLADPGPWADRLTVTRPIHGSCWPATASAAAIRSP